MRCAALRLLALMAPLAGLPACAGRTDAAPPLAGDAAFFTTSPAYFASPQVAGTESAYLAIAPFYTSDTASFLRATRGSHFGHCPSPGHVRAHGGHRR